MADARSAVPDARSAVPDARSAVPDARSAVPDARSAVPDARSAVTDARSTAVGVPEYTATGLPGGLSMSGDGVISGRVTSLGTHTVTISGPEATGACRSVTFNWIVL